MERSTKLVAGAIVAVLLAVIFLSTYFTVDQNEMTVVTRFGHFEYVADPGLHFKAPFVNSTTAYRIDLQSFHPDKPVNTYTIDNQEVDVVFTVFYRIPAKNVECIYATNRDYEARLFSMSIDRLKAAMGGVNVQSVAEKRGELRDRIKATLVQDAASLCLEVMDFQLTDMAYTQAFRQANEQASVKKAGIESAEYERQQAEKTALTAKIQAEGQANAVRAAAAGDADAALLKAQAEAKAIQVKGEAQATAIQAQATALKANPDLTKLRQAERWDGKLPAAIYAGAPIPFLQVDKP